MLVSTRRLLGNCLMGVVRAGEFYRISMKYHVHFYWGGRGTFALRDNCGNCQNL